jgi:uncharacterized protein YdiU (UPF0061 family)
LRRKLGLATERDEDSELAERLFEAMAANHADFTLTFRRLCDAAAGPQGDAGVRALFADPGAYDAWAAGWRTRLSKEPRTGEERAALMRKANPAYIPRNHLVEAALKAATELQDYQPFEEMLEVLAHPWEDRPERAKYALPARPEERVSQTFCGT